MTFLNDENEDFAALLLGISYRYAIAILIHKIVRRD